MDTPIEATVIISFYNKIDALHLVLAGFEIQSYKDFEIIIADDGSKPEVILEVNRIIETSPLTIRHVWHEDEGWRKNEILNKAVQSSNSEYLIFIDGDCIPHHRFVEEHLKNKQTNTILAGRRVNLTRFLSKQLSIGAIKNKRLQSWYMFVLVLLSLIIRKCHAENCFYFRSKFLRELTNGNPNKGVLGSNFSLHKKDLYSINGFDTRYKFPTVGEDTDLELRLRANHIKVATVKHMAIQYHLYHSKLSRKHQPANMEIYEENKKKGVTYTPYGIS
jgi:glycosyltransferase involved in cell wall biosynthesis